MCGIIGYLGKDTEAVSAVLTGLELLQNRGYDSAGVSLLYNNNIKTLKYASTTTNNALSILKNELRTQPNTYIAIGHTRWATHGSKTDINAHPHNDSLNRISLVHNGIIENYSELKSELVAKGYVFTSSTDTEVISILIGSFLDQGKMIMESIQKTIEKLKGTWAIVIIHKDYPNKMWAVRNGSPLLLGTNTDCMMIASESIAFHTYISNYIVLHDHDIIEIEYKNQNFIFNKNIQKYNQEIKNKDNISINPDPYPHWMLKEIQEQPDAVLRAMNNGARIASETTVKLGGLDACRSILLEAGHLIILGCGTSYHAGMWSLDVFKSLHCFDTVSLYDGADFSINDIPRRGKSVVILLSQSGETKDLQRCIQIINDEGLVSIGVVNVVDSFIAREAHCGVYLNAGREVAVASTKSFTNQCIVLSLVAIWFSQNRGTCEEKRRKIIIDLRQLSIQISAIFTEENNVGIKTISSALSKTQSMFLLGKGKEEAIAKEGALKIKEIACIHAEGYSTSALKHGPFGLLEPHMPVIIINMNKEHHVKTANAIAEINARGADIYVISDNIDSICILDSNVTFGSLLANIWLQWLSYECSIQKGLSPDYPRNLAKVVTVE